MYYEIYNAVFFLYHLFNISLSLLKILVSCEVNEERPRNWGLLIFIVIIIVYDIDEIVR